MTFAVTFTVSQKTAYPTRKRVHLIENTVGNISTVERKFLNAAIYTLYDKVCKKTDRTYYGMVGLTRSPTKDYDAVITEDRRVADLFTPELNEL